MSIRGQVNLNIGSQNQQAGSDSLYVAFNKIQNNFTTLFSQASTFNIFAGGAGIGSIANATTGTVTINNTGVLNLNPGTGITLSGSNGNVTVSVSGNVTGELVAGVTNVGISSNTLSILNSPIVGAGNINVELPPQTKFAAGTYIAPTVDVDQYGRITNIASTTSTGTVTSVAITTVDGLAVTGGPITGDGVFEITNTGVLSLAAGPGISLSGTTGDITISAGMDREVGTVTRVGIDSNTLSVTGSSITTDGNLSIELPTNIQLSGNISANGNVTVGSNLLVNSRATFSGVTTLGPVANIKVTGGTNGYVLSTDGTGNLSWVAQTGGTPGAVVATGSNTQIQFNDAGYIGANANLTFNKTTGTLTSTLFAGSGANLTNIPGANISGNIPNVNSSSLNVSTGANFANGANVYGTLSVFGPIFSTTPLAGSSNLVVATTEFVSGAISTAVSSAVANLATNKANIASPVFTGIPQAPTASLSAPPSTQIATTAYVNTFVTTTIAATVTSDATKANIASPTFTGTPSAPTPTTTDNTTKLATTAFVQTAVGGVSTFPRGGIIMWSGSIASIPAGWTLCNGTNGAPDLRDRFVIGAGTTYSVNQVGGNKDAVVVSHTHTASITDPGHNHSTYMYGGAGAAANINLMQVTGVNFNAKNNAGASETKTTGITVSNSTEGVSGINQNLPPYFALAFIMKL